MSVIGRRERGNVGEGWRGKGKQEAGSGEEGFKAESDKGGKAWQISTTYLKLCGV